MGLRFIEKNELSINVDYDPTKEFACLLGSPVAHSISPDMHNYSFDKLGIDAKYYAVDVKPEQLKEVLNEIRHVDFLGANVTMPLKTEIIKYIDKLDISSELAGSVNTIVPEDGQLVGYTTDGAGFIDSLSEINVTVEGKDILILGAGGAATSIIVELALQKANSITIAKRFNKSLDKVKKFAANINEKTNCNTSVINIEDNNILKEAISTSHILINATPVGMTSDKSLIDKSYLRSDLVVCDLIYEPAMTKLLQDASDSGCRYINGKYMLLYQGARSFKLWTDLNMPIEEVKDKFFS